MYLNEDGEEAGASITTVYFMASFSSRAATTSDTVEFFWPMAT